MATVGFVSAYQCHLHYWASFETWFITLNMEVSCVMFLCQVQPGLSVGLCKNTSSLIFMNLMDKWNTSESHRICSESHYCLHHCKVVKLSYNLDVNRPSWPYINWDQMLWVIKDPKIKLTPDRCLSALCCHCIICSICSSFLSNMPKCFPPPCPSFMGLSTVWSPTWGLRG